MKRAEKVLYFGEQIMAKAIEDEDFKLALQAVDRARASLEQLLKVHGLLQPEAVANVTIDQRRQVVAILSRLSEDELRALIANGAGCARSGASDATAMQRDALPATSSPAL